MAAKEAEFVEPENTRRIRRDPETTRALILDAAERLMVSEGYAAVSTRRIAQEIGLNAATIHYYYPATDDLFIALHARMTERSTADLDAILAAGDPLRAFWEFQSNWAHSALGVEFIALSNHRKSLQPVLAEATGRARALQEAAVRRVAETAPVLPDVVSPLALTTILVAITRTLANEERVGITTGHEDVRKAVDWVLTVVSQGKG